ncbi:DUF126 domain-containing protein [Candidatus Bipolaricaulota bacterium]|nr:DUF126 domain-containing protein [Candidatus Bipolaricaulota bacterium]
MGRIVSGRPVVAGAVEGVAVVSTQPLSFWGGLNPQTGEIIDRRHDCCGEVITGKVFVFPQGKGSSTASAVLLESIKLKTAPVAIINVNVDPILALGAIVAEELYHKTVPIVALSQKDYEVISDGDHLIIKPDGTIEIAPNCANGFS